MPQSPLQVWRVNHNATSWPCQHSRLAALRNDVTQEDHDSHHRASASEIVAQVNESVHRREAPAHWPRRLIPAHSPTSSAPGSPSAEVNRTATLSADAEHRPRQDFWTQRMITEATHLLWSEISNLRSRRGLLRVALRREDDIDPFAFPLTALNGSAPGHVLWGDLYNVLIGLPGADVWLADLIVLRERRDALWQEVRQLDLERTRRLLQRRILAVRDEGTPVPTVQIAGPRPVVRRRSGDQGAGTSFKGRGLAAPVTPLQPRPLSPTRLRQRQQAYLESGASFVGSSNAQHTGSRSDHVQQRQVCTQLQDTRERLHPPGYIQTAPPPDLHAPARVNLLPTAYYAGRAQLPHAHPALRYQHGCASSHQGSASQHRLERARRLGSIAEEASEMVEQQHPLHILQQLGSSERLQQALYSDGGHTNANDHHSLGSRSSGGRSTVSRAAFSDAALSRSGHVREHYEHEDSDAQGSVDGSVASSVTVAGAELVSSGAAVDSWLEAQMIPTRWREPAGGLQRPRRRGLVEPYGEQTRDGSGRLSYQPWWERYWARRNRRG